MEKLPTAREAAKDGRPHDLEAVGAPERTETALEAEVKNKIIPLTDLSVAKKVRRLMYPGGDLKLGGPKRSI